MAVGRAGDHVPALVTPGGPVRDAFVTSGGPVRDAFDPKLR
ncbi:hypothetical protein ACFW1F_29330 [Streptomyces bungoensis]